MISFLDDKNVPRTVGPKAHRLSELARSGFLVPRGFIVPAEHQLNSDELERALQRLSAKKYAVRSSFISEDSNSYSFAGIFESAVNVSGDNVMAAIERVRASAETPRAQQYAEMVGVEISSQRTSVIVQTMVEAELYGVCFTENPTSEGEMVVSIARTPVGVTSGESSQSISLSREGAVAVDSPFLNKALEAVRETAHRVEDFFNAPQDIEFAVLGEHDVQKRKDAYRVCILQSRPITS